MSKIQKKLQKKKKREREVYMKILNKRENIRRKNKEIQEEYKSIEAVNKLVKKRIELEEWSKVVEGKISEDLRSQIQNNVNILKALEEEYAQEMKQKSNLQEKFREQGIDTLPEMIDALQKEKSVD